MTLDARSAALLSSNTMRSFSIAALVGTTTASWVEMASSGDFGGDQSLSIWGSANKFDTFAGCQAKCDATNGCVYVHYCDIGSGSRTGECWGFEGVRESPTPSGCAVVRNAKQGPATTTTTTTTTTTVPRSPTDPDVVRTGDAPTCQVVNGHTVVNYSPTFHASFKCAHTGATCACTAHPTHAKGGCMEIVHTNGVSYQHAGDCTDTGLTATPTCSGRADGQQMIKPDDGAAFEVTCQDGWVVIQKRTSNTDFYKGWTEYANGFGDLNNFWLGNDKIHRITQVTSELKVDMTAAPGEEAHAQYTHFKVGDAASKYTMTASGYSGNAGDSLASMHSGHQFSTKDHGPQQGCSTSFKGAWWYSGCHMSNLNGQYLDGHHSTYADGINWYTWKDYHHSMTKSVMMVR